MANLIRASLLSANMAKLGEEAAALIQAGADGIHLDIMDNHFVPNLTFGPLVCSSLRKFGIRAPLDAHLMVTPADDLIHAFADAGADLITIHPESTIHLDRSIELIRQGGAKVGIALNPTTPLHYLDYVMEKIDLILLMSVNPGFGGQEFIPGILKKITAVRTLINSQARPIQLQVDGGVKLDNIQSIAAAGANDFVIGSALFISPHYSTTLQSFREQLA